MYPPDYSKFQIKSPSADVDINKVVEKVMISNRGSRCNRNGRPRSTFGKDKEYCLCKVLRPIIWLWQIAGILPVSHDRETCEMTHKWFSILAFHNIFWTVANFFLASIAVKSMERHFISEFQKIDMYAFSIVVIVQFIATILIFSIGNFSAPQFLKGKFERFSDDDL